MAVFVDTGAWFAYFVRRDPDHAAATDWVRRNRQPKVPALVTRENSRVRGLFDVPQRGVAAGQSTVFYDQENVLGGGIIL